MMIPHHEQAVEMSDLLLAKDERQTMTGSWRPGQSPSTAASAGTAATCPRSSCSSSATLATGQRPYLEGMIDHDEGAVTTAQDEIANDKNPDAIQLAENIVKT
jgi:uncharacterized protein (DUF305 family)